MLSMIPAFTGAEYKSNAEKKVFRLLQEANIETGYAFHSVGLPIHEKKIVFGSGFHCRDSKGDSLPRGERRER